MPLKKIIFKPGVNRENTRYTTEGGWYDCDKIRFRQGTPEKLGGWQQVSNSQFLGICRALWPWSTLDGTKYIGLGTNLKYYVALANGGAYKDITPIRSTTTINNNPFALTASPVVTVTDTAHGCVTGDFVTFSGATNIGAAGTNVTAAVLNQEFQVTVTGVNTYTIDIGITPNATAIAGSPGGGAAVVAAYQLNVGDEIQMILTGWGAGGWGLGGWGVGSTTDTQIRIWNHYNFGEDLLFGPKDGGLYYWDASAGTSVRGVAVSSLAGASNVPTIQHLFIVSDASRFVLAFGCNDYGSSVQDTMLIRWSDQESAVNWTPAATSQAGSLRLSHGSLIEAVAQVRQEILVWTDTSLYSLQYLGPPIVWGSQLLADNVSILSDRSWATAAGVTYWMGNEKFYMYDGRVQTLICDLRQFIFSDFNFNQTQQVFASTNEQFNEVWWFYCSANSNEINRYAIYNYVEKAWYYGNLGRTAWIDSSVISEVPLATDYNKRLIAHETGVDDNATTATLPIEAYITSSQFDIDDGYNFGFIWRVLPDVNFTGSTVGNPTITLKLLPLQNSGSGYNNPESVAGTSSDPVVRSATIPIEQFTGQINTRVRGRQISLEARSTGIGTQWQLGATRIDIRHDGRKS